VGPAAPRPGTRTCLSGQSVLFSTVCANKFIPLAAAAPEDRPGYTRAVTHAALETALRNVVVGEVRFDPGARAAYASDASNYRQVPIGVVLPRTAEDIVVERALGEGVAVVQQDLLDQLRIHDEDGLEAKIVIDHDGLVVEIFPSSPPGCSQDAQAGGGKISTSRGGLVQCHRHG